MNQWQIFQSLIPRYPRRVGTVGAVSGNQYTLTLPSGGTIVVMSEATYTVGTKVFFRNGVIEGTAPDLPGSVLTV